VQQIVPYLGAGYLSKIISYWIFIPLASLAFGYFFLLGTNLIVHEANHNMFIISRNMKKMTFWNNAIGTIAALFYGIDFQQAHESHLVHHIHKNTVDYF
jgi:fatty acid desaturase